MINSPNLKYTLLLIILIIFNFMLANYIYSEELNKPYGTEIQILTKYLRPNASVSLLKRFDNVTGESFEERPAVYITDINNDGKDEVAAACNIECDGNIYSYLLVLDQNNNYSILYESPLLEGNLWIQDFYTFGFQLIDLNNDNILEILLITSEGASIGAKLHIFEFQKDNLMNITSINKSYWKIEFKDLDADQQIEILLYKKDKEGKIIKEPIIYRWRGY